MPRPMPLSPTTARRQALRSAPGLALTLLLGLSAAAAPAAAAAAAATPVIHHDAVITFDVGAHTVHVVDRVTLPAAADSFALDRGLAPLITPAASAAVADAAADAADDLAAAETSAAAAPGAALAQLARGEFAGENRQYARPAGGAFTVAALAFAHQPTDEVRFSRENVGGEITATVGSEGIWLSGASAWLPASDGAMHAGTFTIDVPAGWFPVFSGEIIEERTEGDRRLTTYRIDQPVDGLPLVANTFTVTERDHAGVTIRTCLLEPDPKLSELYLERTAHYLDLYADLLGPYPYRSFTTVENWFPTGYGMPGWTLLGSQVLRLPFIPYTSFGHEIAHNWWGNSVFVDPAEGNWCEGLTVWCADYLYKLQESEAAAREYRRNQLKDYAAYVGGHPERDFPLAEFKARHSGATRAVGYGKSMAIWHMLEQRLGRETVLAALRQVYAEFQGRPAAWSDFFAALEQQSGEDLDQFRAQWLERTGAPVITLAEAGRDGDEVRVTLRQEYPAYELAVPVVIERAEGMVSHQERHTVLLHDTAQTFAFDAPGAVRVSVDPDYDLFRRLHPAEIEPTLSQVLAADSHVFVAPAAGAMVQHAAREFAAAFCECDAPDVRTDGTPADGAVNVLINPSGEVLAARRPPGLEVHGDLVFLDGLRYSLEDHDLVFAAPAPGGGADLVVLSRNAKRLAALGSRLGHYGKYSWLLFPAGAGRAERGNWAPADSPLTVALED